MRRAQQGEERAYAELLVLLTARARSYVRVRTRAPVAWIDDVVQEALMAIHDARHTYDAQRPFAPWFYAIVHYRFVDMVRRSRDGVSERLLPSECIGTLCRCCLMRSDPDEASGHGVHRRADP